MTIKKDMEHSKPFPCLLSFEKADHQSGKWINEPSQLNIGE
jgi:hypothetical protein